MKPSVTQQVFHAQHAPRHWLIPLVLSQRPRNVCSCSRTIIRRLAQWFQPALPSTFDHGRGRVHIEDAKFMQYNQTLLCNLRSCQIAKLLAFELH